jgi:ribosomal-protein-alanine N-acetyltransferase
METGRLSLSELSVKDTEFIFELLNTPQWIKFIGDKNIKTKEDAATYINKIRYNPVADYWVVKRKEDNATIGVVTFIKRDYLDDFDIGFAFLERYGKKGYAYEAAKCLLDKVMEKHKKIVATVLEGNKNSIHLLQKLGLHFEKEITVNNEQLLLYSTTGKNPAL